MNLNEAGANPNAGTYCSNACRQRAYRRPTDAADAELHSSTEAVVYRGFGV